MSDNEKYSQVPENSTLPDRKDYPKDEEGRKQWARDFKKAIRIRRQKLSDPAALERRRLFYLRHNDTMRTYRVLRSSFINSPTREPQKD